MAATIKEPIQYESMIPKIVKKELAMNKTVESLDFKDIVKLTKHADNQADMVKNIQEIFPDIELNIELVTSLKTTPNDMGEGGLTYKLKTFNLPTEAQSIVTGLIGTYVEDTYKISDKLNTIVEESLFTKGSFVELNIPTKNIDDMLTLIKKNVTVGVESIIASTNSNTEYKDPDNIIKFTSDPSMMLADTFKEKRAEMMLDKAYNNDLSAGVESLMVADNGYGIMDDSDLSGDKSITKKISSSKVIPIINKEDPSKHYGYFIVLNAERGTSGPSSMSDPFVQGNEFVAKINNSLKGMTAKAPELGDISGLRDTLIKTKLNNYLKNSVYKDFKNLEFDIDDATLLDMADSIIKKAPIDILFVPTSLVSYYAINYRTNGMGEGLLERLTVLMSMRAMLVFTKMLSHIKSSVTTTDVKVDLDPDDPEYRKSMEAIMAEVIKNRQVSMPIGILNIDDLTDWVHKLGFSFNFKHPGLPDVNIDIEENSNEITPIDDSLKEDIDKLIITSLYLTPEMIDNSYSPDFATTIIANNVLLKKRIMKLQGKYNILLTNDVVKKLKLDGKFKKALTAYLTPLVKKIRKHILKNNPEITPDVIKSAKDGDLITFVVNKIIENITVTLPRPEVTEDTNTTDLIDNYTDLLDNVVDKLFSSDLIPSDYIGTMGDNLDDMKSLIKHTLLRRYVNENNVLPDFTKMFTLNEDGKPLFNLLSDFNTFGESLEAIIVPFLKENKKMVAKLDKKQDRLDSGEEEPEEVEEDNETEEVEEPTDNDEGGSKNSSEEEPVDDLEVKEPTDKLEEEPANPDEEEEQV